VELELGYAAGFLARPNLQGEGASDWDDNVNDLQFRERCEYGVGHGVAVEVVAGGTEAPADGPSRGCARPGCRGPRCRASRPGAIGA
jgi:hypothetical protein